VFLDKTHFSLRIEEIKLEKQFDLYIEAVVWFYENETDQEMTEIVKMLNQKILDSIEYEAQENKLLKHNEEVVRLM
jgi:uncharacterized protein YtpQ (UPF0354 family)